MHAPIPTQNRTEQFVQELIIEIRSQLRGMWRFRRRALVISWVFFLAGWLAVYSLPNVYNASARIYVDAENALRPFLQGIAMSSDLLSEVTVVTREMLSRPNLAEVARSTDLDHRAESDAELEALLASLRERISVSGNRENIYTISYDDPNRGTAIAVVSSLVNTFVEKSLGGNRLDSDQAQEFLRKQIAEYERRLTEAEDRLAAFKRENVSLMPGQGGDYFSRLQSAKIALAETESKLRLAEERRAELLRQIEGEEPTFGMMNPTAGDEMSGFANAKIRELEQQLEVLRLQFTDKHPKIGQILDTIESLKRQEAERRASPDSQFGARSSGNSSLDQNPVYQNMRIRLTNTDVEIASLRTERAQQRGAVENIQKMVETIPQVEAELGRLNRDYDVIKSKYEQLLQQLESANIGKDVDASIDEVQFRIIEPPFSGLNPVGPKRQILLTVVLVLSLGVGLAVSFLSNMLNPVFYTSRAVTAVVHIPVLGSVSMLLSPADNRQKRRQKVSFAAAIALMVASYLLATIYAPQWSEFMRASRLLASL